MNIETGLLARMVLQRTRRGVCDVRFSGTCAVDGAVRLSVSVRGRPLPGWRDRIVGQARGGVFAGRLHGLATGGPYDLRVSIADGEGTPLASRTVRAVLVGDVWLLAGQSNMQGIGHLRHAVRSQPGVRAFYMHDRWAVARDPLHRLCDAMDAVHGGRADGKQSRWTCHYGVGPGVAFGQAMHARTGVPQGLIAGAHGGTSLAQWDPRLKDKGGASLYGALLRRVRRNGGRVAGVVWYQGESDTFASGVEPYRARMRALVRALRRDGGDPALPFVAVQLGRVVGVGHNAAAWTQLREAQRRLPESIRHCAVVPAIDLALDDFIHIHGADQHRLGARLAQAMGALRGERGAGPPPIALRAAYAVRDRITGFQNIVVAFERTVGHLRAAGRPSGFELANPDVVPAIYHVELRGRTAVLRTTLTEGDLGALALYYGRGLSPYCNLVDAADRAVPAFGPVLFGRPIAATPFVQHLRVSGACPSADKLERLAYPRDLPALALQPRHFPGVFCDLHEDLFRAPDDVLVWFACAFVCATPMKLSVCVGYDGPIKVWLDGRPCYHDPLGANPAVQDRGVIPFAASAGRHEALVALGSNHGKAWGLFLRFIRRDVTRRQLAAGPAAYQMPEVPG